MKPHWHIRPDAKVLLCLALALVVVMTVTWAPSPVASTVNAQVAGPPAPSGAAPSGPQDVPEVLVTDPSVRDWSLGGGFLYWANSCPPGTEFPWSAYLRSMPSHGGPTTTLATMTNDTCANFLYQVADETGLYYFNWDGGRQIEWRSTAAPTAPSLLFTVPEFQDPWGRLAVDEKHVYWFTNNRVTGEGAIYRGSMKTGVIGQVVNSSTYIDHILLSGSSVYWSSRSGIYVRPKECQPLCMTVTVSTFSGDTRAGGLLKIGDDVYWSQYEEPALTAIYRKPPGGSPVLLYTSGFTYPRIGELVTNGTNLYWEEGKSAPAGAARLLRKPLAGGSAVEIAGNLYASDLHLASDDLGVYFRGELPNGYISRISFNPRHVYLPLLTR
jgi:hypothetical protein